MRWRYLPLHKEVLSPFQVHNCHLKAFIDLTNPVSTNHLHKKQRRDAHWVLVLEHVPMGFNPSQTDSFEDLNRPASNLSWSHKALLGSLRS
jgi:hypothetical protein